MARSRLPLRAISVFETVARFGSFKAAADELNLTPSAVSHQIRTLEEELGVRMFLRETRGVTLTAAGADYAERLRGLFDSVRSATDAVSVRAGEQTEAGVVRIMTPPSLATHWLMPRLPAFLDAHPGIDIRVIAIRTGDGNEDDFDIVIAYGNPARGAGLARPLLEETYRPYCAPSLLLGAASIDPYELLAKPLIRSRYNDITWQDWFAQRGVGFAPGAVDHLQIDPSYVAIEAAVNGVGVVLESGILTHEHVRNGRLVAPVIEPEHPAVSYWILPLRSDARRSTRITHDWLLEQGNCRQ